MIELIEFMDEIVEATEQIVKEVVKSIFIRLAKIFILITSPIWLLPYIAIRAVLKRKIIKK